jgi:hypothetical protein
MNRNNKILKLLSLFACLVIVIFGVWNYLPLKLRKYSDVNFGNRIVDKIEKYKLTHSTLPNDGEWKTFEKLDFEMTELGTNPEYKKVNENNYELIFVKGFDGPYLTYNSLTKDWSIK